jgi:hypothetical protein
MRKQHIMSCMWYNIRQQVEIHWLSAQVQVAAQVQERSGQLAPWIRCEVKFGHGYDKFGGHSLSG